MIKPIRLDVHAHLAPVDIEELEAIDGVTYDDHGPSMHVDGNCVSVPDLFQPKRLTEWMDANGISKAWVSIPPPLYRQNLDADATLDWCKYVNDGLLSITRPWSGRLSPLFHLPTDLPEVAAKIVEALGDRGYHRFSMPCGAIDGRSLSDAEFEPLWHALDTTGAFVFMHPGQCCDGRLKSFYLSNLIGNPYETLMAIAHIIFSGILDRHSRITMCFAHCGGLAPMAAGRLQRGFACGRPGIAPHATPPEHALKLMYVDCITHDEIGLSLAENTFGSNHIIFGSDWPFPMGINEPARQLKHYDVQRLSRLFDENAVGMIDHLDNMRRARNG